MCFEDGRHTITEMSATYLAVSLFDCLCIKFSFSTSFGHVFLLSLPLSPSCLLFNDIARLIVRINIIPCLDLESGILNYCTPHINYVLRVTLMFRLTFVSGIIPVTFLVDNIGDSSLRMKYRYLGGQGTKPLAAALKVSNQSSL